MSNEKSHKIDAIKYFVPLPEGDYDFQEHLTDYLLTDILNANKQLEKYEARVKELEEKLKRKEQECEQIKEKYEALKLENEEGYEIVAELKHECEELKERLERIEEDLKYQCVDCMNVKSDRYRKALEEIEEYTKKYFCENCEDFNTPEYSSHCEFCEYQEYFDTINKAKGEGNV